MNDNNKPPPPVQDDDDDEFGPIYMYRWIDCQDEYYKWYETQIIEIDEDNQKRFKVHYKGWKSKFDSWIDRDCEPDRVRILHTFTDKPESLGDVNMIVGTECDCLDSTDKWFCASIVEVSETHNLCKIHYKQWESKYDEWICKDSYRIAPLHTMTSPEQQNNPNVQKKTTNKSQSTVLRSSNRTNANRRRTAHGTGGTTIKRRVNKRGVNSTKPITVNTNNANVNIRSNNAHNLENSDDDNEVKQIDPMNASPMLPSTSENKNEENDGFTLNDDSNEQNANNGGDNDDDEITEKQRAENEQIRQRYISNFKPSLEDETNFNNKLRNIGLKIESMGEDGNCLFRSMSHQVYGKEDYYAILRKKCVEYLKSEFEYFGAYVPGGTDRDVFHSYCDRMSRDGVWGDNLEIQAFSEIYERSIEIYAYSEKPMKTFSNENDKDKNAQNDAPKKARTPIRLSYHCNSHYNSIINPEKHYECDSDGGMLLDDSNVGQVENEKIRLSYLRSSAANNASVLLSDIEATDVSCFNAAVKESRKLFEDNNISNQRFDVAIAKSLKEYEEATIENAKIMSIKDQEQRDLAMAMKMSMNNGNNGNTMMNDENYIGLDGGIDIDDSQVLAIIENSVIKRVVDEGYSVDQATIAYSIFEGQKDQIDESTLVGRMIDYIKSSEKSLMYGFNADFGL